MAKKELSVDELLLDMHTDIGIIKEKVKNIDDLYDKVNANSKAINRIVGGIILASVLAGVIIGLVQLL